MGFYGQKAHRDVVTRPLRSRRKKERGYFARRCAREGEEAERLEQLRKRSRSKKSCRVKVVRNPTTPFRRGMKGKLRRRSYFITDREWSRRQAISAGRFRARLAKKIANAITADLVLPAPEVTEKYRQTILRVLLEEGF